MSDERPDDGQSNEQHPSEFILRRLTSILNQAKGLETNIDQTLREHFARKYAIDTSDEEEEEEEEIDGPETLTSGEPIQGSERDAETAPNPPETHPPQAPTNNSGRTVHISEQALQDVSQFLQAGARMLVDWAGRQPAEQDKGCILGLATVVDFTAEALGADLGDVKLVLDRVVVDVAKGFDMQGWMEGEQREAAKGKVQEEEKGNEEEKFGKVM